MRDGSRRQARFSLRRTLDEMGFTPHLVRWQKTVASPIGPVVVRTGEMIILLARTAEDACTAVQTSIALREGVAPSRIVCTAQPIDELGQPLLSLGRAG